MNWRRIEVALMSYVFFGLVIIKLMLGMASLVGIVILVMGFFGKGPLAIP